MANSAAHIPRTLKFNQQSIRNFVQSSSFLNSTQAVKENYQNQNRIIMASTQQNFVSKPKGFDFYNKNNLLLKACNIEDIQYIDKNPVVFQEDIIILPNKAVTTKNIKISEYDKPEIKAKSSKDFYKPSINENECEKSKEAELNEFLFNYRKNQQQKRNKKLKFLAQIESRINDIEKQATNLTQQKQKQYQEINGILKIHTDAAQFAKKAQMIGKLNSALHQLDEQNTKLLSPKKIAQDMELLEINAAVEQHREYNDALLNQIQRVSRSKSKQRIKKNENDVKHQEYGKTGMKQHKTNEKDHGTLSKTLKRPMQVPPRPNSANKKLTSTMRGKN